MLVQKKPKGEWFSGKQRLTIRDFLSRDHQSDRSSRYNFLFSCKKAASSPNDLFLFSADTSTWLTWVTFSASRGWCIVSTLVVWRKGRGRVAWHLTLFMDDVGEGTLKSLTLWLFSSSWCFFDDSKCEEGRKGDPFILGGEKWKRSTFHTPSHLEKERRDHEIGV